MLTISDVSKRYGGRVLFEDASLQVNMGDRIGLVGPNGAGKSTLFSLLLGDEEADSGTISFERGVVRGHLPQESAPVGEQTVLELATTAAAHDELHDVRASEPKAKRMLAGLSFREKDFNRPLRELSGGWVMRAHLARLLVLEPDLLMLDEPTNHLDLESLQWFQGYLKSYPGAILMISHDRNFLNKLCTQTLEIRQSRLFRYSGNYESYLEQKAAAEAQQLAAYKNQQREIAHKMEFVERFRAKNTKASQAQSKLKQIEKMEKIEAPTSEEKKISFSFPQPQRSGLKAITLKNVAHAYGENVIYTGVDFEVQRGQRIVLVGPNGAGKSTLLKLLAGVIPVQGGERELGHNVKLGYYSQWRVDMLNAERTVFEEGMDTPQRVTEQFVRTALGSFLFRGDDVFKKVSVLSGGEKSRLALVKLLLDPPNLLLMDEPTTHLDMASIDALVGALKQFQGTLVFISHDVHFIRVLANHVVRVENGRLRHFTGGYQYYLDKTSQSARAALTSSGSGGASSASPGNSGGRGTPPSEGTSAMDRKEQRRIEAGQRQARSRKKREIQGRITALEREIDGLEAREKALTAELEKPETYAAGSRAMQVNRELMAVHDRLAVANAEWEKAGTELAQFEAEAAAT